MDRQIFICLGSMALAAQPAPGRNVLPDRYKQKCSSYRIPFSAPLWVLHRPKEIETGSAMGDGQHALVSLLIHDSGQGFDHLTFVILSLHVCAAQRALPGPGHEPVPDGLPGTAGPRGFR